MGRRIPADETALLIHPLLSLTLFIAGMVTTIAVITALCSFRRKSSHPPSESPASKTEESDVGNAIPAKAATAATTTPQNESETDQEKDDSMESKELPLPPRMKNSGQLYSGQLYASNSSKTHMKKSASERRLLSNLSIKLPRSLSMAKKDKIKEEIHKRKTMKLKAEDSIWMKTIILGEKCKVPDEDEVVIYDTKGRKIPAYHPKSRQNSFIDPSAIPDQRVRKIELENKMNRDQEHRQESKINRESGDQES